MPEISAQDLATLNDLLAGHMRAGLPLEPSLRAAAADWPGHAGTVLRDLTERLQKGDDLETALGSLGPDLPTEYVALVRAGRRSGRLPAVLDELTKLAAMRLEARRLMVLSTVYPILVALVALGLGLFVWTQLLPGFLDELVDARTVVPPWLRVIAEAGRSVGRLFSAPVALATFVAVVVIYAVFVSRLGAWSERHTRRLPMIGTAWREANLAYWTRLVALLLEHGTPEAEAVELAGAVGDDALVRGTPPIAEILRSGHRPKIDAWRAAGVSPLAAWAVSWPGALPARLATLRAVSDSYDRRSRRRYLLASRLLPLFMLVTVGGLFALVYGLLLFLPLASLYEGLS